MALISAGVKGGLSVKRRFVPVPSRYDEIVKAPVLSQLYGADIQVVRADGHIFVMSRGRDVERVDHMHDHDHGHGHDHGHSHHHH